MDYASLRIAFSFRGEEIESVSMQPVHKPGLVGEPLDAERSSGFWIELQDEAREAIYRRAIRNPLATDVEYLGADGAQLARAPATAEGEAVVVVPFDPQAESVALFGAAAPSGHAPEAHELTRVSISDALSADIRAELQAGAAEAEEIEVDADSDAPAGAGA
jgi:hypothetical protein